MFAFIQPLIDGLTIGIVYVLLAAGLSVIFGVMHVINFAHGELAVLGAYFGVVILVQTGIGGNAFIAALLIAPILVGIIGYVIERFTIRPLYGRNPLYHILLTFGLVLVINDSIFLIWGTGSWRIPRPEYLVGTVEFFSITFSAYNLFMIAAGAVMALVSYLVLEYTRYGLIVRAGSQDRQMTSLLGIDINRYYSLVFGFGAALAGFAGLILAASREANPDLGMNIIIPAFVIVVIGGLGSFKGAVVAGLLVGILQESILRPHFPALEGMVIFVLMIAILMLRPKGLFGSEFEEGTERLLTGTRRGLISPERRVQLGVILLAGLALVPILAELVGTAFWLTFMNRILIWGLFAVSLDFIMGYTGLVSLGHAMFLAVGAYVTVIFLVHVSGSIFIALALAIVLSAMLAWVVGFVSIRVHGVYFALITLAFAEVLYTLYFQLGITGGSEGESLFGVDTYLGIAGIGIDHTAIAINLGIVSLTGDAIFYYIVLGCVVASYLVARRMLRSPFGAVLKSIRENEHRSTFVGYDTIVYKRRAFVVSGALAGLAGGLFALNISFVSPSVGEWLKSGEVIVMVILGGMGTLYGPIIGSGAYFGLEHMLGNFTDRWRLFLGAIFVLFVLYLPRGLVSLPDLIEPYLRGGPGLTPGAAEDASGEGGDA